MYQVSFGVNQDLPADPPLNNLFTEGADPAAGIEQIPDVRALGRDGWNSNINCSILEKCATDDLKSGRENV